MLEIPPNHPNFDVLQITNLANSVHCSSDVNNKPVANALTTWTKTAMHGTNARERRPACMNGHRQWWAQVSEPLLPTPLLLPLLPSLPPLSLPLPSSIEKPDACEMRNVRRTRWTDAWTPKQTHTHTSLLYMHRVSSLRSLGILLNTQMLCLNKSSTELIEFAKFLF